LTQRTLLEVLTRFPFTVREVVTPGEGASALFARVFRSPPPDFPRHFILEWREGTIRTTMGYVHYTAFEPGVFLCGGLCIDTRIYRRLPPRTRARIAAKGSLSRWLLERSIGALGTGTRAVFAFTGDERSRRDILAIGFVPARTRFLFVQWRREGESTRLELVKRVTALGPF
jgi:hypothetical protein